MPTLRADFWCTKVSSTNVHCEGRTPSLAARLRNMRASGLGRRSPNMCICSMVTMPSNRWAMPRAPKAPITRMA